MPYIVRPNSPSLASLLGCLCLLSRSFSDGPMTAFGYLLPLSCSLMGGRRASFLCAAVVEPPSLMPRPTPESYRLESLNSPTCLELHPVTLRRMRCNLVFFFFVSNIIKFFHRLFLTVIPSSIKILAQCSVQSAGQTPNGPGEGRGVFLRVAGFFESFLCDTPSFASTVRTKHTTPRDVLIAG